MVTADPALDPDASGAFTEIDTFNGQLRYKVDGKNFWITFDTDTNTYYIADNPDFNEATLSWFNDFEGTEVEGEYSPTAPAVNRATVTLD